MMNKKETNAQIINQSFMRTETLRKFNFEGKEDFYDTFFRTNINQL